MQLCLEIVTNELWFENVEPMAFGRWMIQFLIRYFESDNSKEHYLVKHYLVNIVDTAKTRNQETGKTCHKFHVTAIIKRAKF